MDPPPSVPEPIGTIGPLLRQQYLQMNHPPYDPGSRDSWSAHTMRTPNTPRRLLPESRFARGKIPNPALRRRCTTRVICTGNVALKDEDYEHLKGLEQFVGEWHTAMSQKGVEVFEGTASYKWTNKSFLLATYCDEKGDHVATEIFGWDAATNKIRLWSFKPDGGRNEAVISIEGDIFSGDYDMIPPDGTTKKSVVKGKFSGKEFNVTVRFN